ncbi:hypothetical protein SS1G_07227 [Sclerotinia sclerotiorum 1980 UF-70]|uniref:Uncharacterized protein n=1 Tax=Sclerotinia sclerotiorum (strain ATCC 18683 / 1980 / Ss-1) TaxID=665079 RepID=A7EPH8_SCLS1|nr:hypothetical protein SS1G_07227 [Sclerotinia sclerotiorum 1980 UF-70]EDO04744.1 hypothetical protein SS1G_07227 [Sclerotinia sclerotiorum 1980 UF-70]
MRTIDVDLAPKRSYKGGPMSGRMAANNARSTQHTATAEAACSSCTSTR